MPRIRKDNDARYALRTSFVDSNGNVLEGPIVIGNGSYLSSGDTAASLTITSADINGGTIDGTTIGGTTAAAGTFTTFTSTGIDDNATSTAITIDSSQNVGIGQTAPDSSANYSTLHIGDNASAPQNGRLILEGSTNKFGLYAFQDYFGVYDYTGGANRLTINSSGDVGIGDSTPANRLQVTAGGVNNAPTLGSIDSNAQLYLTNSDTAYGLVVGNSAADGHVWMQAQRTDGTATAYNITLNEAGGNVGIGIAPGTDLDVYRSTTTASTIRARNDSVSVYMEANNGYSYLNTYTNHPMLFGTNNTERMRIDASGNVGIGDGAISATLDVHSTTDQSEISVEGSGGKWATLLSGTGTTGPALCFDNTSSRFRITSSANKLGTGQTEHFIVEPSGDVGIGAVPGATRLEVRGSTTNSTAYAIYCSNSGGTQLFFARNDGLIGTGAAANSPYNLTTASSANLHVGSTGLLYRSTSSARYKKNIQDLSYGVADVMKLRPVTFESNGEDTGKTYAGFIAEEVHDAGLVEFVEYNEEGQPDAVHYSNMVSVLTKAVQDQQATIEALTARIEQLEAN